jgi:predicted solute-binding protein
MLRRILNRLFNTHQNDLDRYISQRFPKNTGDVERFLQEYYTKDKYYQYENNIRHNSFHN